VLGWMRDSADITGRDAPVDDASRVGPDLKPETGMGVVDLAGLATCVAPTAIELEISASASAWVLRAEAIFGRFGCVSLYDAGSGVIVCEALRTGVPDESLEGTPDGGGIDLGGDAFCARAEPELLMSVEALRTSGAGVVDGGRPRGFATGRNIVLPFSGSRVWVKTNYHDRKTRTDTRGHR
jgi:hypothetical protein